ncbi:MULTISPECIES: DUF4920 domain-containing protein [Flavobacterium]|uniref:DUF4920 domain-containing protein n=1 Tax=Flavobacterium orientale TaxID=1756020 RepID=A0A916Y9T4_9FLAO|nr:MULTISPECIES: DUF4920 domain-containing protein [Flavobacterium]GGD35055.1 hypothetical protein GCM10011343_26130 [Flavobacterium orientale]
MKKIILSLLVVTSLMACKKNEPTEVTPEFAYASFGDSITAEGTLTKEELLDKYTNLKEGDTIEVKFASVIKDVCQKKGCWMNVDLGEDKKAFIRFKDYGFFMPLNAAGSEAIMNGKAFVSVESVDVLKHYAKDAGKSQEEIDAITEPEVTYSFTANGVLIKE